MDVGGSRRVRVGLLPPDLPNDIIIEILLRLSVRKLSKFRCVCKQWYALISDPNFRRLHLRRSEENPLLLIGWSSKYENATLANANNPQKYLRTIDIKHGTIQDEITLPAEVSADISYIVHSSACFDMICLVGLFHIYVCNPTTGELIVTLPFSPHRRDETNLVLGRGPSSKECKLVSFTKEFYNAGETTCEILTLSGGTDATAYQWRDVEEPPFALSNGPRGYMPCINGTVYLMADFIWSDDPKEDGQDLMAAFDIERETFQVFSPPACFSDEKHIGFLKFINLFELEGSLCLAGAGDVKDMQQVDLWMLKEDSNESRIWVKEYSIDLSMYTASKEIWDMDIIFPIAIVDGKILMEMWPRRKLAYYDPPSKKFNDFKMKMPDPFSGCLYVQNFLSLGRR